MGKCAICQETPLRETWVCVSCAEEWGLIGVPFKDWPDWVKALKNCEQQMRRAYVQEELAFRAMANGEAGDDLRGGSR